MNNANKFSINNDISLVNFHCDFEKGISNAAQIIFPNIHIKYCVWHFKRSLEIQKNRLCSNEIDNNNNLYEFYKAISNFPFINPGYIFIIFEKIYNTCEQKNYKNFLKFLNYFENN